MCNEMSRETKCHEMCNKMSRKCKNEIYETKHPNICIKCHEKVTKKQQYMRNEMSRNM